MLDIVPLDTVRAIFEFLDLKSLIRCRTICKYMKNIIDRDYIIRNYRKKLINLSPEAVLTNKTLKLALINLLENPDQSLKTFAEEIIFTDFLLSDSSFQLYGGEHLMKPEQPIHGHAIVLCGAKDPLLAEVIVLVNEGYKRTDLKSWLGATTRIWKFDYESLQPGCTIEIVSKLLQNNMPKRSREWTAIQFAFFCKTRRYIYPETFISYFNDMTQEKEDVLFRVWDLMIPDE